MTESWQQFDTDAFHFITKSGDGYTMYWDATDWNNIDGFSFRGDKEEDVSVDEEEDYRHLYVNFALLINTSSIPTIIYNDVCDKYKLYWHMLNEINTKMQFYNINIVITVPLSIVNTTHELYMYISYFT